MQLTPLEFKVDGGFGQRARIGLIVLETDQTLEPEINSLDLAGVTFYHSRIPMEDDVSADSLGAMMDRLPAAAGLLPSDFEFDAVGYGCTSAATVIGAERVADAIGQVHPGVPTTDPITAAIAAFGALEAGRIAIVTPYVEDVTNQVVATFNNSGIEVVAAGSFLEPSDLVVARISPESITGAVRTMAAQAACDAVFVSCTSLRSYGNIASLELELGVPVVSSNQAFLWHLLRLAGDDAGIDGDLKHLGQLFQR